MSRPAAFFDLDRTLIDVNSGFTWAQHELREGNLKPAQFARAALWTGLYHLSLIDMERAFNYAVVHYKGVERQALKQRTHEWFMRDVERRLRPQAARTIEEHRAKSHPLVLLTSSSCFEAESAAQAWRFDAWLANDFHTDEDGRLVGTFITPMCYGPGKVTHAKRWAEAHDIDLEQSYFYTDSLSDLPMLEQVAHPRIVSPDPRLRRVANKRGWPILMW